jgi:glycosyltransferase involved in cell wall biosynthesis
MSGALVDVLVPTRNRPGALALTLACVAAQTLRPIRVVVSDQSDGAAPFKLPEVAAVLRYLAAVGVPVAALRHLPRRGMAEQRAFLLAQAEAPACLFLDDDVLIEPALAARMHAALREHDCGFIGSAVHGLSHVADERPRQQAIEYWTSRVAPERVRPGSAAWERHHLHSAANLWHLQRRLNLGDGASLLYRVAWVGGCVLFDTARLRAAGGFDFWQALPDEHSGEDVFAQLRVMARYGGAGLLPSGAYHMELPTTIAGRSVDAPRVLPL